MEKEKLLLCQEISNKVLERGIMKVSKEDVFDRAVTSFILETFVFVGEVKTWQAALPVSWFEKLKAWFGLRHKPRFLTITVRATEFGYNVRINGVPIEEGEENPDGEA